MEIVHIGRISQWSTFGVWVAKRSHTYFCAPKALAKRQIELKGLPLKTDQDMKGNIFKQTSDKRKLPSLNFSVEKEAAVMVFEPTTLPKVSGAEDPATKFLIFL